MAGEDFLDLRARRVIGFGNDDVLVRRENEGHVERFGDLLERRLELPRADIRDAPIFHEQGQMVPPVLAGMPAHAVAIAGELVGPRRLQFHLQAGIHFAHEKIQAAIDDGVFQPGAAAV